MNHLNYLWAMIGTNSGQLQTLLAMIGLILAVIAALYAKKQIKLSQDQRLFELKLSILSLTYECKDLVFEIAYQINALKEEHLKWLKYQNLTLEAKVEGCDYDFNEYFNLHLKLLKGPEDVINKLIFALIDDKQKPSLNELEEYLKQLTTTKGIIYSDYNKYLRNIEDLKQKNELFNQLKYPHN
ncbi:hypothetical protein [Acinetobacter baumannii]|uniref:hypothetical protein n=1 Tax=Acinetobacter baumannii TaxID=470 RepID=UPI0007A3A7ED|nr:hypothetical protein [Acinetobacter baumannii]EHU2654868.1 hypothetical protein [Acinetobacter baumannii]EHU2723813.1 hypothetical protein [Acinetobacter baumannii]EHU2841921.1 hypothetical protein [Acinetobacter baumannii]EHU3378803.1 hypothetical protein [Acinetobacter baumannii]EHU3391279.1 hypothetical protein [Acinetobacter baumannii]